jgi:hypothetical protein
MSPSNNKNNADGRNAGKDSKDSKSKKSLLSGTGQPMSKKAQRIPPPTTHAPIFGIPFVSPAPFKAQSSLFKKTKTTEHVNPPPPPKFSMSKTLAAPNFDTTSPQISSTRPLLLSQQPKREKNNPDSEYRISQSDLLRPNLPTRHSLAHKSRDSLQPPYQSGYPVNTPKKPAAPTDSSLWRQGSGVHPDDFLSDGNGLPPFTRSNVPARPAASKFTRRWDSDKGVDTDDILGGNGISWFPKSDRPQLPKSDWEKATPSPFSSKDQAIRRSGWEAPPILPPRQDTWTQRKPLKGKEEPAPPRYGNTLASPIQFESKLSADPSRVPSASTSRNVGVFGSGQNRPQIGQRPLSSLPFPPHEKGFGAADGHVPDEWPTEGDKWPSTPKQKHSSPSQPSTHSPASWKSKYFNPKEKKYDIKADWKASKSHFPENPKPKFSDFMGNGIQTHSPEQIWGKSKATPCFTPQLSMDKIPDRSAKDSWSSYDKKQRYPDTLDSYDHPSFDRDEFDMNPFDPYEEQLSPSLPRSFDAILQPGQEKRPKKSSLSIFGKDKKRDKEDNKGKHGTKIDKPKLKSREQAAQEQEEEEKDEARQRRHDRNLEKLDEDMRAKETRDNRKGDKDEANRSAKEAQHARKAQAGEVQQSLRAAKQEEDLRKEERKRAHRQEKMEEKDMRHQQRTAAKEAKLAQAEQAAEGMQARRAEQLELKSADAERNGNRRMEKIERKAKEQEICDNSKMQAEEARRSRKEARLARKQQAQEALEQEQAAKEERRARKREMKDMKIGGFPEEQDDEFAGTDEHGMPEFEEGLDNGLDEDLSQEEFTEQGDGQYLDVDHDPGKEHERILPALDLSTDALEHDEEYPEFEFGDDSGSENQNDHTESHQDDNGPDFQEDMSAKQPLEDEAGEEETNGHNPAYANEADEDELNDRNLAFEDEEGESEELKSNYNVPSADELVFPDSACDDQVEDFDEGEEFNPDYNVPSTDGVVHPDAAFEDEQSKGEEPVPDYDFHSEDEHAEDCPQFESIEDADSNQKACPDNSNHYDDQGEESYHQEPEITLSKTAQGADDLATALSNYAQFHSLAGMENNEDRDMHGRDHEMEEQANHQDQDTVESHNELGDIEENEGLESNEYDFADEEEFEEEIPDENGEDFEVEEYNDTEDIPDVRETVEAKPTTSDNASITSTFDDDNESANSEGETISLKSEFDSDEYSDLGEEFGDSDVEVDWPSDDEDRFPETHAEVIHPSVEDTHEFDESSSKVAPDNTLTESQLIYFSLSFDPSTQETNVVSVSRSPPPNPISTSNRETSSTEQITESLNSQDPMFDREGAPSPPTPQQHNSNVVDADELLDCYGDCMLHSSFLGQAQISGTSPAPRGSPLSSDGYEFVKVPRVEGGWETNENGKGKVKGGMKRFGRLFKR